MNKSYFFKFILSALITCPLVCLAAPEPWTIEDVLDASSELSQQMRYPEAAPQKPLPQVFVLVSFSMPEASLERRRDPVGFPRRAGDQRIDGL